MSLDDLKTITFFQNLQDSDLDQLNRLCFKQELSEGDILFREGEPASALYALLEGSIALYRDAVGKPTHLLERVPAGEILGEVGLFDDGKRTASAQASVRSQVLRFDRRPLLDFLDERPFLALRLQMAAARRHSVNVAATLDMGRREVLRIKVGQQVVLTLDGGQRQLAVLENLSPVGLCLSRAPKDWQPEIAVSFTISKGRHTLDLDGRIAWRRGNAVGIAFLHRTYELDRQIQHTLRLMLSDDPL